MTLKDHPLSRRDEIVFQPNRYMESDYLERLSSFVKWPICDEISVTALARLGFIYKEDICTLVCAYCNIQLNPNNCLLVEDILREHQQLSPRCNLVSPNTEEVIKQSATLSRFNDTTVDYSRIDKINYGFRLDQTSPATTSTDPVNRSQFSFDELCIEAVRLSTFRDWPLKAKVRPQVLARDGFFYEGSGDRVQCAFCNGCIGNWEALDEPSERHKRLFPDCHFVCGFDVGNISLVGDTSPSGAFNWNPPLPAPRSPLETANFQPTTLPQTAQNLDAPKYSEYADFERRVESFRNTIVIHGQTPEALAEAGFFYIGPLDRTRCFHCGGVLRDWEPDDNPIHEHRRWFERCAFVQSLPIETKQHKNIEPHEVKARLDSPIVRIVLDMGYSIDLVKQVIENQLSTAGDDFRSAESLLEAIFAQEKEISVKSPDVQSVESEPQSSCSVSTSRTEEGNVDVTTELKSETPIVMLSEFDEQPAGTDESLQFLEENRRLRDARTCKVCMDAEVNTVLLPCGHLVCCTACSALIGTCPVCRVLIKGTVKTFLS